MSEHLLFTRNIIDETPPLRNKQQHALDIPEIAEMIVSRLSTTEVLLCRGVCRDWRRMFSPYLELHAIYWNQGPPVYKANFEARLETLGQFVQSLKQVYPTQSDLERIQRTCTQLRHITFFLRDKDMMSTQAMVKFLQAMPQLERIELFSHHDKLVTAFLFCLASHPAQSSAAGLEVGAASTNPAGTTKAGATPTALKGLEIRNAAHSMRFSTIEWGYLEAVLARHPHLRDLTLREARLLKGSVFGGGNALGWAKSFADKAVQQNWNWVLSGLAGIRRGERRSSAVDDPAALLRSASTTSLGTSAGPFKFNHIESLVLDNIELSEELFVNILCRCPSMKILEIKLTGVELPIQVWPRCLPHCRQLTQFSISNEHGGIQIDVPQFWRLAPPTLHTFHVSRSHGAEAFFSVNVGPTEGGGPSLSKAISSDPQPGFTLVSLELTTRIGIADRGVRYVMAHCHALESLVLGFHYFLGLGYSTVADAALDFTAYPEWACGGTLKKLQLQAIYRRYDQEFDERTHLFMKRLEDLRVLKILTMPAKLLGDLSESHDTEYMPFKDLLDQLDTRALLLEQELVQLASGALSLSLPLPTLSSSVETDNPTHRDEPHTSQQTHQQQQQQRQIHEWARDGSEATNFIPQMPSVKEVLLTSAGSFRFPMQMRFLHILMEAMPGLGTIWTEMGLYDMDCIPRFKYVHARFQELYGSTGVELNLGSLP